MQTKKNANQTKEAFTKTFTEVSASGELTLKGNAQDILNWISSFVDEQLNSKFSPPFENAFTGLFDKKGTAIHEGDNIRLYYKGQYVICKVIYDSKHAAFLIQWPDGYVNQYFMNGTNYEIINSENANPQ